MNNSMKARRNRGSKTECKLEKGDRDKGKNKWMVGLKKIKWKTNTQMRQDRKKIMEE
jgi:hypothetical protein